MDVKTEILMSAKEIPTTANNILKYQKASVKGMMKQKILTNPKAISIEFLMPILGKNEATKKEQIAIGKSLNPSKTLAWDFEISKFCCTCKITVPTELSKIANTK